MKTVVAVSHSNSHAQKSMVIVPVVNHDTSLESFDAVEIGKIAVDRLEALEELG